METDLDGGGRVVNEKMTRFVAEFDALTCAIDDAIDQFMVTAKGLDQIDVMEALRAVRQTRQDRLLEGDQAVDWSELDKLFGMDGRGTE
jgi:hypothetical protein